MELKYITYTLLSPKILDFYECIILEYLNKTKFDIYLIWLLDKNISCNYL